MSAVACTQRFRCSKSYLLQSVINVVKRDIMPVEQHIRFTILALAAPE